MWYISYQKPDSHSNDSLEFVTELGVAYVRRCGAPKKSIRLWLYRPLWVLQPCPKPLSPAMCVFRHILQGSPYLSDVYTLGAVILMPHCCIRWNVHGLCMVVLYANAQTAQLFWINLILVQMIVLLPATIMLHHHLPHALPLSCYPLWSCHLAAVVLL